MIINPPALKIVNHHTCTSCGATLPTPGRWAWVLGNGQRGELCVECAALSPVERAARAVEREKRTAVPERWTAENYQQYLRSAHWRMFKAEYAMRHKRKCMVCGVDGRNVQIDLHHNDYSRLGNEYDDDVVYLCHDHHSLFHGKLPY